MSLTVTVLAPADPAAVWSRFADVDRWPDWNPTCVAADLGGALATGTTMSLQLRHPRGRLFHTRPTVTIVEPEHELAWETRAFGVRAPTLTRFEASEDGTLVTLTSSSRGPLAFAFRLTFPEKAQALLYSGMLTGLARSVGEDRVRNE